MSKLLQALSGSVIALGVLSTTTPAQAGLIDVGPLPVQSCKGVPNNGSAADCVRPTANGYSYTNLDKIIWRSGGSTVFWICNVNGGYNVPTENTYDVGCGRKTLNYWTRVMTNPVGPNGVVDVYVKPYSDYTPTKFDLCTSACPNP